MADCLFEGERILGFESPFRIEISLSTSSSESGLIWGLITCVGGNGVPHCEMENSDVHAYVFLWTTNLSELWQYLFATSLTSIAIGWLCFIVYS